MVNSTLNKSPLSKFFDSPVAQGLAFLVYLSIGDRISEGLNPYVRNMMFNPVIRYIAMVFAAYITTKNIFVSVIVMIIYVLVVDNFLNPDSPFSLVGHTMPKSEEVKQENNTPKLYETQPQSQKETFMNKYKNRHDRNYNEKYGFSLTDNINAGGKDFWAEVNMNMKQSAHRNKLKALDEKTKEDTYINAKWYY